MCNELDDLKSHCTVRSDMFNVLISAIFFAKSHLLVRSLETYKS